MVTSVGFDQVTLCLGWSSSRPHAELPHNGVEVVLGGGEQP